MRRLIEERAPCGAAGGLTWLYWRGYPYTDRQPDLSDVLVARPKPFRLVLWEPLPTLAPSPARCQPFCCYTHTVIFYHRPYITRPFSKIWRSATGWHASDRGRSFEEWGRVDTRLCWDDVVAFDGERFDVCGGSVTWARKRWWMMRDARRRTQEQEARDRRQRTA
jgi:hypothetical protein